MGSVLVSSWARNFLFLLENSPPCSTKCLYASQGVVRRADTGKHHCGQGQPWDFSTLSSGTLKQMWENKTKQGSKKWERKQSLYGQGPVGEEVLTHRGNGLKPSLSSQRASAVLAFLKFPHALTTRSSKIQINTIVRIPTLNDLPFHPGLSSWGVSMCHSKCKFTFKVYYGVNSEMRAVLKSMSVAAHPFLLDRTDFCTVWLVFQNTLNYIT